jgi:mannose-6-phosphate isomerase-like protein (cupin superfamily)
VIRAAGIGGADVKQVKKWKAVDVAAMLPPESTVGRRYAEPFTHGTMRLGYYAPRGHDPQQPHEQDELYFIQSGSGTFLCGEERVAFAPGDALFVPAQASHRFEDFSDDFAAWVVFWGPAGGE